MSDDDMSTISDYLNTSQECVCGVYIFGGSFDER